MKIFIYLLSILCSFQALAQSDLISIEITTDNFPEETYWTIEDVDGNIIEQIYMGDLICSNTYYSWDVYVSSNSCYTFTIYDNYGDGICCSSGTGSYSVNFNNSLIYSGGQFHQSEEVSNLCNSIIIGCTNPNASNYNSSADTNIAYGGILNNTIASGGYFNGNQHLIFDAYSDSRIISAVIYTQNQCAITFEVRDNNGNTIDDTTTNVSPGGQRVYLNFDIVAGSDYELGISGTNPGIYRSNDQTNIYYPYNIGNLIEIKNSSANVGYYYFYYDIQVEALCTGFPIYGCTDMYACNFQSTANSDDGSCAYTSDSIISVHSCDAYTWIDGVNYTNSGTYTNTYSNIAGCDSTHTLNLTINNSSSTASSIVSCDSYIWNGVNYTNSGTYTNTYSNIAGCDSTHTLNLTINNSSSTASSIVSCDSYIWNGVNYTNSGTYTNTYSNIAGCDSTHTLNLTINYSSTSITNISANNIYTWNNTTYTNSGAYTYLTTNTNGCDSIANLTLTIISVIDFSPEIDITLSNNYCDSLSDLTITVEQDSGEVDMSTSLLQSNLGAFDISAMSYGDTIGTAYLMAAGGAISLNTYIMVSLVINQNQAIIVACDSLQGCIGSFTINNTPGGGVSILTNTVFDGNNYTAGNMSSITFENCFINPCGPFNFTTTINSELGDTDTQIFNYNLSTNLIESNSMFIIYPNPTYGDIFIKLSKREKELKLSIYDVLGRKKYLDKIYYNTSQEHVKLPDLKRGSYIIKLEMKNNTYTDVLIRK